MDYRALIIVFAIAAVVFFVIRKRKQRAAARDAQTRDRNTGGPSTREK